MEKNKGKIRFEIALERIHSNVLEHGFGTSVLWSTLDELSVYALTGKLSRENTKPDEKDLYEIDYGKPKGIKNIDEEYEKQCEEKHGDDFFTV
jgi:hypothetical protein